MIGGVGFFHFVANQWKDPVGSLKHQLSREPRLERRLKDLPGRDFLIVLPECFNFAGNYRDNGFEPKISANDALQQLADISREYRIVFIAGLLHAIDRFNSAYLVDADLGPPQIGDACRGQVTSCRSVRLLCHKAGRDGTDKYTPSPEEAVNCGNPSHWKGAYVGALLCVDTQRWGFTMENRLTECKCGGPSVLCIPAWMNDASGLFSNEEQKAGRPGPYRVLANSDPEGCQSFITNRQGDRVVKSGKEENFLFVRTWAELDTAKT
jgi:hypothetical protein